MILLYIPEEYYYGFYAFVGVFALLIWYFVFRKNKYPEFVHSHWSQYFPDTQFSSIEFYKHIEDTLKERQVPEIEMSREVFSEGGIFSHDRFYQRIKYGAYSFDISAVPYGKGFFVSWWFGEDIGWVKRLLMLVPLLRAYLRRKMLNKTYYAADNEAVFRTAVHTAVLEGIEKMTGGEPVRIVNDYERQPQAVRQSV